jgi:hypothetical protein
VVEGGGECNPTLSPMNIPRGLNLAANQLETGNPGSFSGFNLTENVPTTADQLSREETFVTFCHIKGTVT